VLLATPQIAGSKKQCFSLLRKMQEARSSASCYSTNCRTQEAALLATPQNAGNFSAPGGDKNGRLLAYFGERRYLCRKFEETSSWMTAFTHLNNGWRPA